MCCARRPAELLCALHYMGSGARPYLYPVTDSPIIIPTIIVIIPTIVVTWKHRKSYFEIRRSWGPWDIPIYELSDSCEISDPSDDYDDDDDDRHHPTHHDHDHDHDHDDYHDDDDDDMSVLIIIQVDQNGDYHDIDDMSILIIIQAGHHNRYHDIDDFLLYV